MDLCLTDHVSMDLGVDYMDLWIGCNPLKDIDELIIASPDQEFKLKDPFRWMGWIYSIVDACNNPKTCTTTQVQIYQIKK